MNIPVLRMTSHIRRSPMTTRTLLVAVLLIAGAICAAVFPSSAHAAPGKPTVSAAAPISWTSAVNISRDPQQSLQPIERVDSKGTIHAVWLNTIDGSTTGNPWEVKYAYSTDGGAHWSKPYAVESNGSQDSSTMQDVAMAIDTHDVLHVVWSERGTAYDRSHRVQHIYYSRHDTTTDGSNWLKPVELAQTVTGTKDPYTTAPRIDIAVDPSAVGLIHVVWVGGQGNIPQANYGVYYANSTDGVNWSNFIEVSDGGKYGDTSEPTILAEPGGNVHVVWRGISFGVKANHGTWDNTLKKMTWQHIGADKTRETIDSYGHAIALARNPISHMIYAVYQSYDTASSSSNSRGISFASWDPANPAQGWIGRQLIVDAPDGNFSAEAPTIALDGQGRIFVAYDYKDSTAGHGIAYMVSSDGGQTWPNSTVPTGTITSYFAHFARMIYVPSYAGHPWFYIVYAANNGSPTNGGAPNYDISFSKAALDGAPNGPAPTISAITPGTGSTTTQTVVRVDGANFSSGLIASIGTTALTRLSVLSDGNSFYATVPAGIAPGTYDLVVTNVDTQKATLAGAFTVTP